MAPLLSNRLAADAADELKRSAAATAALYRAACVARSHAEFRAKIGNALEECDESVFWLEYLRDCRLSVDPELGELLREGTELTAILAASKRTAMQRAASIRRGQ